MKSITYLLILCLLVTGCVEQFIPEIAEDQNLIVVDGIITDQPGVYTIKLSKSSPLGSKILTKPLTGCTVSITDDLNNTVYLTESKLLAESGTYFTDPLNFSGVPGRKYVLEIKTNNSTTTHYTYRSLPMEMIPVPRIDSLFYKKVTISGKTVEGCQIYLNTHDQADNCRFFRWDYTETWKFQLPLYATILNRTCWITNNSKRINIKNTSVLSENRINNFPLVFISNETDRLSVRYSILVNQFSVSEDEYNYWEKLQNIAEEVGSLYDITPSSVSGNIYCVEDRDEQVLGYFSVSSKHSKRIYIEENFKGLVDLYSKCTADTTFGPAPHIGLNVDFWILEDNYYAPPTYKIITYDKSCVDCTVRGTKIKPEFWSEN